jgi:hypothetical protein
LKKKPRFVRGFFTAHNNMLIIEQIGTKKIAFGTRGTASSQSGNDISSFYSAASEPVNCGLAIGFVVGFMSGTARPRRMKQPNIPYRVAEEDRQPEARLYAACGVLWQLNGYRN